MATPVDTDLEAELTEAYQDLIRSRERYAAVRARLPQPTVREYQLTGPAGASVTLASLFGDKDDLILIHNMGTECSYCTLWADGFNGVLPHLENRAAFIVVSPDDPATQAQFAESRGWQFRMVSSQGTSFRADMGFQTDDEVMPGVSVFRRQPDGTITHVAKDFFGPGDEYCGLWHLFDLLPGGAGAWEPQFTYSNPTSA